MFGSVYYEDWREKATIYPPHVKGVLVTVENSKSLYFLFDTRNIEIEKCKFVGNNTTFDGEVVE